MSRSVIISPTSTEECLCCFWDLVLLINIELGIGGGLNCMLPIFLGIWIFGFQLRTLFGRVRRCGLSGGSMSLGLGFGVSKAMYNFQYTLPVSYLQFKMWTRSSCWSHHICGTISLKQTLPSFSKLCWSWGQYYCSNRNVTKTVSLYTISLTPDSPIGERVD